MPSVKGDALTSIPTQRLAEPRSLRMIASPRCPALPVTRIVMATDYVVRDDRKRHVSKRYNHPMARGPYRSSGERPRENSVAPVQADLGALCSSHVRTGLEAVRANLLGNGRGVDLHAHGLIVHDSRRSPNALPYTSVDAVYLDFESPFHRFPRITLVTFDGERVVLPRVTDMHHLLAVVDRELMAPISQEATNALRRGERLEFGPLVLTLDGIEFGSPRESYPWSDVARAQAGRAELVLYGHEPRGRLGWVRLREVPHPTALFAVLRLRIELVRGGPWSRLG